LQFRTATAVGLFRKACMTRDQTKHAERDVLRFEYGQQRTPSPRRPSKRLTKDDASPISRALLPATRGCTRLRPVGREGRWRSTISTRALGNISTIRSVSACCCSFRQTKIVCGLNVRAVSTLTSVRSSPVAGYCTQEQQRLTFKSRRDPCVEDCPTA
jgi:hypothetical protein